MEKYSDGSHVPVIVVGGGPVGLALISDLGWRGVPALLIERKKPVVDPAVKIMDIGVRTMEFCRRFGVTDRIRNWGFPLDYPLDNVFVTSMKGHEISRISMPSLSELGPTSASPEWQAHCPQIAFDPILRDLAGTFDSVTSAYEHEVLEVSQDSEKVTVSVRDLVSDKVMTLTADYLVGCDGLASTVRRSLGIAMQGRDVVDYSLNFMFRSPGFNDLGVIGHGKRYVMVGEQGTWATVMAVDGKELWRLTFYGANDLDIGDVDIEAAMRKICGDVEYVIESEQRWTRRALVADRFQQERIYIAGDAAHAPPPNGGFGMNTGFADAMNLGWKLAAVVDGWADPSLIATYEVERRPIAQFVVKEALENYDRLTAATKVAHIEDSTPQGEDARQKLGARLHEENLKAWKPVGIHLGYQYTNSPVIDYNGAEPVPFDAIGFEPAVIPGVRAPHAWLSEGKSVLDLFGKDYVVLRIGADAPSVDALVEAAAKQRIPLEVELVTAPDVVSLYASPLVVVRPDGHVAWKGEALPADADTLAGMLAAK